MQVLKPERSQAGPPEKREHFSGAVRLHYMVHPSDAGRLELIGVFFEPGARTVPHVHATDQALYILDGEGIVATEHDRRIVHPGDIAVIPAGLWHWHGATRTTAMGHLSMRPSGPTDWTVDKKNWGDY